MKDNKENTDPRLLSSAKEKLLEDVFIRLTELESAQRLLREAIDQYAPPGSVVDVDLGDDIIRLTVIHIGERDSPLIWGGDDSGQIIPFDANDIIKFH